MHIANILVAQVRSNEALRKKKDLSLIATKYSLL
jgi:hypothetical protein